MREVGVAAVQLRPRRPGEALEDVARLVSEARRLDADIICLPEAWNVVNPYSQFLEAVDAYGYVVGVLSRLAEENGVCILGGGLYKRRGEGGYVIACPVVNACGELAGEQLKVHLFKDEKNRFRRGDEFRVFEFHNVRFGVLICHDIVYPESARELVLRGAEVIFNPSRIVSSGVGAWHIYARARSLENRTPVVAVNVVLNRRYGGGSLVLGLLRRGRGILYPVTLAEVSGDEGMAAAKVDVDEYLEARAERLSNRHPRAYRSLLEGNPIFGGDDMRGKV